MKTNTTTPKAINCAEAVKRFNDFIDHYIEGKYREELINHISECKHCFDRLEFEQKLKTKVRQLTNSQESKKLARRIENLIASL